MRRAPILLLLIAGMLLPLAKAKAQLHCGATLTSTARIVNVIHNSGGLHCYTGSYRIESPSFGNTTIVDGTSKVSFKAGRVIDLQPGFNAGKHTAGDAYFNASILGNDLITSISAPGTAVEYEKFEIELDLAQFIDDDVQAFFNANQCVGAFDTTQGLNPFDPDDISIEVTFLSPTNVEHRVYGFYYEGFTQFGAAWVPDFSVENWRARFAFDEVGTWQYFIRVSILSENCPTYHQLTDCNSVNVSAGTKPGYLKVADNDRYLEFDDGSAFFGIGMNFAWTDYNFIDAEDYAQHAGWLEEASSYNSNYFRLMLPAWGMEIEWENLGNYKKRMPQAWEIDRLMEKAEAEGMYTQFVLMQNGDLYDHVGHGPKYTTIAGCSTRVNMPGSVKWVNNPYVEELAGVLPSNKLTYFTDNQARRYTKRRIRYLVSRYGYNSHIAAWELRNEPDFFLIQSTGGQNYYNSCAHKQGVNRWVNEMSTYIKELDNRHLVSVSSAWLGASKGSLEDKGPSPQEAGLNNNPCIDDDLDVANQELEFFDDAYCPNVDFSSIHQYQDTEDANRVLHHYTALHADKYDKPAQVSEHGLQPSTLNFCSRISFHNSFWSSLFWGGFTSGLFWHWDNGKWFDQNNHLFITDDTNDLEEYQAGTQFLSDIDFSHNDYQPVQYIPYGPGVDQYEDYFSEDVDYLAGTLFASNDGVLEFYALVDAAAPIPAVGWVHNRSYNWQHLYETPGILLSPEYDDGLCIDNTIQLAAMGQVNLSDGFLDYTFVDDFLGGNIPNPIPETVTPRTIEIKGLLPAEPYIIEWFNTWGPNAGLVNTGTNGSTLAIADASGFLTLTVPFTDGANPDWAFKVLPCKNLSGGQPGKPDPKQPNATVNKLDFEVFPNPHKDFFSVALSPEICGVIRIRTLVGKEMLSRQVCNQSQLRFDVQTFPPGVYIVELVAGEERLSKQVIHY